MAAEKMTLIKKTIRQTFLDMLQRQNFYEIRTSSIIKESTIARSTFYAHYKDKYDLLETIQNDFLEGLKKIFEEVRLAGAHQTLNISSNPEADKFYSRYFEYIEDNIDLFLTLTGPNCAGLFLDALNNMVYEQQCITRKAWGVDEILQRNFFSADYYTVISAGAYVNLFLKWARDEKRPSPIQMGKSLAFFFEIPDMLQ